MNKKNKILLQEIYDYIVLQEKFHPGKIGDITQLSDQEFLHYVLCAGFKAVRAACDFCIREE